MDTVLAAGATGECPKQLLALARAVGIDSLFFPGSGPERLSIDSITQTDIAVLQNWAAENGGLAPAATQLELYDGQQINGMFITQPIWDLLREKAIAATGLGINIVPPPDPAPVLEPVVAETPPAAAPAAPAVAESTAESGRFAESQAPVEAPAEASVAETPPAAVPAGDSEQVPPA